MSRGVFQCGKHEPHDSSVGADSDAPKIDNTPIKPNDSIETPPSPIPPSELPGLKPRPIENGSGAAVERLGSPSNGRRAPPEYDAHARRSRDSRSRGHSRKSSRSVAPAEGARPSTRDGKAPLKTRPSEATRPLQRVDSITSIAGSIFSDDPDSCFEFASTWLPENYNLEITPDDYARKHRSALVLRGYRALTYGTSRVKISTSNQNDMIRQPCVLGTAYPLSFPVLCDPSGSPIVAAGFIGSGRIVALGTSKFLVGPDPGADDVQTAAFIESILSWLVHGTHASLLKDHEKRQDVRIFCDLPGARKTLRKCFQDTVELLQPLRLPASEDIDTNFADVLVLRTRYITSDVVPRLLAYLDKGGSILVTDDPKSWVCETSDDLRIQGGNELLAKAGIILTQQLAVRPYDDSFLVSDVELARSSTSEMLRLTLENVQHGRPLDAHTVEKLIFVLHSSHPSNPLLTALDSIDGSVLPQMDTIQYPVAPENTLERFAVLAHYLKVHRQGFPRVDIGTYTPQASDISLTLCTTIRGWHFLGVYLNPGEKAFVWTAGGGACDDALSIRVGHHLDGHVIEKCQSLPTSKGWWRCPFTSRVGLLPGDTPKSEAVEISSPHGGAVYVVVTRSALHNHNRIEPHSQFVRITMRGGTTAPSLGGSIETTEWQAACQIPGTWGELSGPNFTLTLPTETLAFVEDATDVIHFWERIFSSFLDMFVPHTESHRKVRITVDAQPAETPSILQKMVVLPMDCAPLLIDPTALRGEHKETVLKDVILKIASIFVSYDGQLTPTFSRGLTMLLGAYALEALEQKTPSASRSTSLSSPEPSVKLDPRKSTSGMSTAQRCVFNPSDWDQVECMRFLTMLRQAFGWPIFRTAFALRSNLDRRLVTEGKKLSPDEKVVVLFCFAVQFNLCNQFAMWGFTVGPTARSMVAHLSRWNPLFAEHKPIPEMWFQFEARMKRREALRSLVFANFFQDEIAFNRQINRSDEIEPLNLHLVWERPMIADTPRVETTRESEIVISALDAVVASRDSHPPLFPPQNDVSVEVAVKSEVAENVDVTQDTIKNIPDSTLTALTDSNQPDTKATNVVDTENSISTTTPVSTVPEPDAESTC